MTLDLAWKSLRNRRSTAALTVLSIALSVALLLGVERIRMQAREGFTNTISGTDLVVGARTSAVHLLLFSVFRIGDASAAIRWHSYEEIADRPEIAWTIPLALGDSHRGYRVVGTNGDYFKHLRYGQDRKLAFSAGGPFSAPAEAVLGAEVARALGYGLGHSIVVAHGSGDKAFIEHSARPFRVAGVLSRTGTPADRTIHVPLEGLDALHAMPPDLPVDPLAAAMAAHAGSAGAPAKLDHRHSGALADGTSGKQGNMSVSDGSSNGVGDDRMISAFLVGLKSRTGVLGLQRAINKFEEEPLTAILPGATLYEVWDLVGTVERSLRAISLMVVAVGLTSMLIALLTGLNERRREMSVLRSVGARPAQVFGLILGEGALLTLLGLLLGVALLYLGLWGAGSWLEARYGLSMPLRPPELLELGLMGAIFVCGLLVGALPAIASYRYSLADGMTVRL